MIKTPAKLLEPIGLYTDIAHRRTALHKAKDKFILYWWTSDALEGDPQHVEQSMRSRGIHIHYAVCVVFGRVDPRLNRASLVVLEDDMGITKVRAMTRKAKAWIKENYPGCEVYQF